MIDGKEVVNLTSNNYLAMADNPKVKKAAIDAIKKYGVGSAAVRTIIGTMSIHTELERKFAEFKHAEASILFQSGFTSNVAVCQSLMSSEDGPADLRRAEPRLHHRRGAPGQGAAQDLPPQGHKTPDRNT